jgi:hypothetical protein
MLLFLLKFELLSLVLGFFFEPHFLLSSFKLLFVDHCFLLSHPIEVIRQPLANLFLTLPFGLFGETYFSTNSLLLLLKLF